MTDKNGNVDADKNESQVAVTAYNSKPRNVQTRWYLLLDAIPGAQAGFLSKNIFDNLVPDSTAFKAIGVGLVAGIGFIIGSALSKYLRGKFSTRLLSSIFLAFGLALILVFPVMLTNKHQRPIGETSNYGQPSAVVVPTAQTNSVAPSTENSQTPVTNLPPPVDVSNLPTITALGKEWYFDSTMSAPWRQSYQSFLPFHSKKDLLGFTFVPCNDSDCVYSIYYGKNITVDKYGNRILSELYLIPSLSHAKPFGKIYRYAINCQDGTSSPFDSFHSERRGDVDLTSTKVVETGVEWYETNQSSETGIPIKWKNYACNAIVSNPPPDLPTAFPPPPPHENARIRSHQIKTFLGEQWYFVGSYHLGITAKLVGNTSEIIPCKGPSCEHNYYYSTNISTAENGSILFSELDVTPKLKKFRYELTKYVVDCKAHHYRELQVCYAPDQKDQRCSNMNFGAVVSDEIYDYACTDQ